METNGIELFLLLAKVMTSFLSMYWEKSYKYELPGKHLLLQITLSHLHITDISIPQKPPNFSNTFFIQIISSRTLKSPETSPRLQS